jgi:hypothetical protein
VKKFVPLEYAGNIISFQVFKYVCVIFVHNKFELRSGRPTKENLARKCGFFLFNSDSSLLEGGGKKENPG